MDEWDWGDEDVPGDDFIPVDTMGVHERSVDAGEFGVASKGDAALGSQSWAVSDEA